MTWLSSTSPAIVPQKVVYDFELVAHSVHQSRGFRKERSGEGTKVRFSAFEPSRGCRQKSERVLNCCKLGRVWRVGVWWQRTVATI